MEAKHTTGLVEVESSAGEYPVVVPVDDDNTELCLCYCPINDTLRSQEEDLANARRIAACWNACEGVPSEYLKPGIVQALITEIKAIRALDAHESECAYAGAGGCATCERLNSAIMAATAVTDEYLQLTGEDAR